MSPGIVTTTVNAGEVQRERAREVAARSGWPYVPRRGPIPPGVGPAYVVGRDRDRLVEGGVSLSVDRGLLHARRAAGIGHPYLRAIGPARRVIDATLGLAQDALHVADVLGCEVVGIEGAVVLASLCEEGLGRLARQGLAAAGRVTVLSGDARARMAEVGPVDVVVLSPMFDVPEAAAPGFELLRRVALQDRLDDAWLAAAFAVAPRVVAKVPRGTRLPGEVVRGRAVDYLVLRP